VTTVHKLSYAISLCLWLFNIECLWSVQGARVLLIVNTEIY